MPKNQDDDGIRELSLLILVFGGMSVAMSAAFIILVVWAVKAIL